MPLSNEQKRLLGNVTNYERKFLAKVIREQIRSIEENQKILVTIPSNWKYENAKSWFLNEINKAESKISEIEEKLSSGKFIWEENPEKNNTIAEN